VLPLIYAVSLTGIMGNSLLAPAIPEVLDDLDVGDGAAGLLIAAVSLPGIAMAPLIGVMGDRYGRRAVLVPCLVVYGVAGLASAAATTFALMVAARFVMGIGAAGLVNLAVVLIGDNWTGAERTRMIGRNAAVLTAGLAVMPFLAGAVTEWIGWRWAVAANGLALVAAYAAWRVLDSARPPHTGTVRDQLSGLGDVLRRPTIVVVLVAGTLIFFVIFGAFLTIMPIHLEDEFGLGAGWRGVFLGLPALASSIVGFNLGTIRSRTGVRSTVVAASATWVVAFTLLGTSSLISVLVVACLLYGAGEGALIPTLQDVAITAAPEQHRGAVVATWVGFARLGQTTGPIAAAVLAGAATPGAALVAASGLSLVLLVLLAAGPLRTPVPAMTA
jgi:MFS transporter, ACDE family, multidrug resistance protein